MAEFVQQRLENSVPHLLYLKSVKILDDDELQQVIKRRRRHEYRIQRRVKSLQVYIDYIKYELNFLMLIHTRVMRNRIMYKVKDIERPIVKDIQNLFTIATSFFPNDLNLWHSYIDFCRKRCYNKSIDKIYTSMMKFHSNNPSVWVEAAKWEANENKSMDNARKLFMRGLRFIPKCKEIYLEMFKLELTYAQKEIDTWKLPLKKDLVEACKVATIIYSNAIKEIQDHTFLRDLLNICRQFECAEPIKNAVYSSMEKSDNEELLAMVATRPLHDAMFTTPSGTSVMGNPEEECIENFEAAIVSKPTEKMWEAYINFCFDYLHTVTNDERDIDMQEHVLNLYERAHGASMLNSASYIRWADLMGACDQTKCLEICDKGIVLHPNDADLWEKKIGNLLRSSQNFEVLSDVFKEVTSKECFRTCLPLWKLAFKWSLLQGPRHVKHLAKPAMIYPVPVGKYIKVRYLEWKALKKGVLDARQLYRDYWNVPPIVKDFFFKMVEIEEASLEPDLKVMREIMENACTVLGRKKIDVWLRYITLERTYNVLDVDTAALLYLRAQQTLRPKLVDNFVTHYSLLVNKIIDKNCKI